MTANSEVAMIVLYMLCLHRDTLRHVVGGTVPACQDDVPVLDKIQADFPAVLQAFRALHHPNHLTAIENMFEGFGRDFLLTRQKSDPSPAVPAAQVQSADDYDDPNSCPNPRNLMALLS